ncbi:MAG: multicopper oxidase family protein [Rhodospirillum sp.]|nr:multicopper oxidase family protein [Rhodospirillum sp.]MCF8487934.1 multicopper oxidase family protein [Rhodospirillum sp.]MCF8500665.1 multicopper oxidase family protein [Rhodospirillum sp.]
MSRATVPPSLTLSRRDLLGSGLGALVAATLPFGTRAARAASPPILTAATGLAHLLGSERAATRIWGYNGASPGPVLRCSQGETLSFRLANDLDRETSVHAHGIRLPNDQDGVPGLTQLSVVPGESFDYAFSCPDAGTFWYHPHIDSAEQVGRGLKGLLVVDDADPYPEDREMAWMVDDWLVGDDLAIQGGFDDLHTAAHGGRLGTLPTVNGLFAPSLPVTRGERLRLRLANGANARILSLAIQDAPVWVIALDGHPLERPRPLSDSAVYLGPGQRMDVILDIPGDAPDTGLAVVDAFDPNVPRPLAQFLPQGPKDKSASPRPAPSALPPNPLPALALDGARSLTLSLQGGAMGSMDGADLNGERLSFQDLVGKGFVWAVNGKIYRGEDGGFGPPIDSLRLGETVRYTLRNGTNWAHPIHLHGHAFKVLRRDRPGLGLNLWLDTILLAPGESVDIAFTADNPGKWMFHCHILSHQMTGMMGYILIS